MEKRTTQSIPFHEGHEHLRKVNRSIRPAFGSRNNVSGCVLSVALEAFSITTDTIRGLQKSRPQAWGDSLTMTPFFTLRGLQKRVGTTSP